MMQMLWVHEIKISIELKIFRNVSIQKYNYQVKIKSGRIENVDDKARKLAIIAGFHMTSPKFKLRNSQIFLSSYFIFKNSSKPIFIQIFTRKRLIVLWLSIRMNFQAFTWRGIYKADERAVRTVSCTRKSITFMSMGINLETLT